MIWKDKRKSMKMRNWNFKQSKKKLLRDWWTWVQSRVLRTSK